MSKSDDSIHVEPGQPSQIGLYLDLIPAEWGGTKSVAAGVVGTALQLGHLLVAYLNGSVVGLAVWKPNVYTNSLTLGPICVAKAAQNKGVGKALVRGAEEVARLHAYRRIFGDVPANGNHGYAKKVGFEQCGSVRDLHDEGIESVMYSKPISLGAQKPKGAA
jgi:predicted N-acetyltransferase YhbS